MLERVEESGPPITDFRLRQVERELNVRFPEDYRKFLLDCNGGRPVPADFLLPIDGELLPWRVHYFFGIDDPMDACSLIWVSDVTSATRPPGTIPIASDESGNFFYLRCSEPRSGDVYFGPTPSDGRRVALVPMYGSFSEFLDILSEIDESPAVPDVPPNSTLETDA